RRPHAPAGRRGARLALRAGPLCSRRGVALPSGTERRSTRPPLPGGGDNRMTLLRPTLVAGLLTFVLVSPCAAQKAIATNVPKPINIPLHELQTPYGQRTDAFRRLLFEIQFQPWHNFGELLANPSESILIVLGEPGFLSKNNFPHGLRSFVEQGGAVLIATDKETEGEAGRILSELAGVRVSEN